MKFTSSRREVLGTLGLATAGAMSSFGQGRCRDGYETKGCPLSADLATAPIKPVFPPTGWKTVALDHITWAMPDYRKEAAFYVALMGWTLRSDDGSQAILDIGDWGSAIFKQDSEQKTARVRSYGFVVSPWNAATVEADLRKRGLNPVAENDGHGFESFSVSDPDGWNFQICNGGCLTKERKTRASAKPGAPAPFESTGWKTVWLDHLSYNAADFKKTASFYTNLLGWKETYDEGSQHELMIGDVGDIIIRGGNSNDPAFGRGAAQTRARIDHISFGISPWDTDRVRAALEKRGLKAQVDTSTRDDIHVAAFKSYHTTTPNGFNLQISYVNRENRLALANAVKPSTRGK